MHQLILIEGLPGSGKTTLCDLLSQRLGQLGAPTSAYTELATDHPITSASVRKRSKQKNFSDLCLAQWQSFAQAAPTTSANLILEACWFQSTTRFLLEANLPWQQIADYQQAAEAQLAPLRPWLIFLQQLDIDAYLQRTASLRKGATTIERIAQHSENTQFAQARGLQGTEAFRKLYTEYQNICLQLVAISRFDVLTISCDDMSMHEVQSKVESSTRWVYN